MNYELITNYTMSLLSDEKAFRSLVRDVRWGGVITCHRCKGSSIYEFSDKKTFKCSDCDVKFSAKTGTLFENSKLPLKKIFVAVHMLHIFGNKLSSCQLSRVLSVPQVTAYLILKRLKTN